MEAKAAYVNCMIRYISTVSNQYRGISKSDILSNIKTDTKWNPNEIFMMIVVKLNSMYKPNVHHLIYNLETQAFGFYILQRVSG